VLEVTISGHVTRVESGTLVGALLPEAVDGVPVVAALIDEAAVSLTTPLLSSCSVRPLTTHSWEGQRIQRRSLALLALEVGRTTGAEFTLRVGPSVGFGQRLIVKKAGAQGESDTPVPLNGSQLTGFAVALEAGMHEHLARGLSLRREHWLVDEAHSYFLRHGLTEAVELLRTWRDRVVPVISYGTTYAIDMGPVVTRSSAVGAFYIACEAELLLLVYGRRSQTSLAATKTIPAVVLGEVGETGPESERMGTHRFLMGQVRSSGLTPQGESFEEQAWLRTLGVSSIGSFNRACIEGSVPDIVRVAEGFHEKRISAIADEVASRGDAIDIVSIAGPSSSGKSTFIRRLCVQLKVNGITPVGLGLDDYYVDRDKTPTDASGDYDFEALEALNLDFVRGKAELESGKTVALRRRDVLLIEGIHGLNPALLGSIPVNRVYRILVCPLMQLALDHATRVHASDVRLVRRIVRDRHARGLNAAQTISRWPKVRAGERRYVYPHQTRADAVFDSSLVYELSVLRVHAERYLLEVPRADASQTTALRLMRFLDRFVSISPDHVPGTSILREFIGSSTFDD
jgi:uridine kinase